MPISYATFLTVRRYRHWAKALRQLLQVRPAQKAIGDFPSHVKASLVRSTAFAKALAEELRGYGEQIAVSRLERAIATNSIWLIEQAVNFAQLDKVLERLVKPELHTEFMHGAKVGLRDLTRLDVGIRFNAIDPKAVQWAEKSSALLVTHVTDSQRAMVQELVARGQSEGRTVGQTARDLKAFIGLLPQHAEAVETYKMQLLIDGTDAAKVERLGDKYANQLLNYRTEMIARHELLSATSEGQLQTVREAVSQGELDPSRTSRVWTVAQDERLCTICAPMDGDSVPADEPWTLEDGSTVWIPQEAHVQCLLPGMLVAGEFTAGVASWYEGPIYEMTTAKGYRLSVTPNHPIATMQGFIPAYALMKGDQVISDERPYRGTLPFGQIDNRDTPPTIQDVIQSLRLRGTSTLQVGRLDLHGDARWIKSKVEIVGANGPCISKFNVAPAQSRSKLILQWGAMQQPTIGNPSSRTLLLERPYTANRRFPSSATLAFDETSICADALPFQPLRVGPSTDGYPALSETSRQGGPAYAQFIGELFHRSAGSIAADCIVKIERRDYSGHVYDLQSTTGFIIAQNICISNCRCSWSLETVH